MGIAWSKLFKNRGQHGRNPKPIDYLIMHYGWLANDLLFEDVVSLRECMGYKNLEETLRTVVKFSPCQVLMIIPYIRKPYHNSQSFVYFFTKHIDHNNF